MAQLENLPAPLRILAFLLLLGSLWLPLAASIALWSRDANQTTIWAMALLFMGFLALIQRWGRWLHQDPQILRTYGLGFDLQSCRELLLGQELTGIPDSILALADQAVTIPQFGLVESLNVQTAAAVAVYEYLRQHGDRHAE